LSYDNYRTSLPRTRDVTRETGRFGGWGLIVGCMVLAVVLALSAAVWAFGVGTSDVRGKGNAYKAKNDGVNRVAAQERFENLYADAKAADARLDVLQDATKANPDDAIASKTYTGAVSYCISARAAYDAEARKYSARDFRATDLPAQIDPLDPTTDCKPTPKELHQ
jgi:hypothetical protein